MRILGLSFFYHDSAACLLEDGRVIAMAEEERFSGKKHDSGYPELAIDFVLRQGRITAKDLDAVVFYEKPFIRFERIMKMALATWPRAPRVFAESIRHLFLDKLWMRALISSKLHIPAEKVLFSGHHLSHAASTFFASPYPESAIVTIDGVGEWATTTISHGKGTDIRTIEEIHFPHSLGLLYSAFTAFLGFEVNEGEYKVMGMAPYGKPTHADKVRQLIHFKEDGSFELDLSYFTFHRSLDATYSSKFISLFGPARDPKSHFFTRETGWPSYFGPKPVGVEYDRVAKEQEYYADVAASVQVVLEEGVLGLVRHAQAVAGSNRLCLAGGVALNSVANGRIAAEGPFTEIFIQPAAGDAGGALGAALAVYHMGYGHPRSSSFEHSYWGAEYGDSDIKAAIDRAHLIGEKITDEDVLVARVADALAAGKVIGWMQGRFEWGPRALGSRSILADPRRAEMKDIVNTKIKFREPYRPFAPSVLAEHAVEFFDLPMESLRDPAKFMLYVVPVKKEKQTIVPAITHVDGSARPQLVSPETSPRYWKLIEAFRARTGIPMVMNTSFNLKGEPIVNTPDDAISTFIRSGIDILVMGDYLVFKKNSPLA